MPKISSPTVTPCAKPDSASVRSFVAFSISKISASCFSESAMRVRTVCPCRLAMKRWVSCCRTSVTGGSASDSATARVEQAPHDLHRGNAATQHVVQRRRACEDRIAVGQRQPTVGETLRMQYVERFEDADEGGDAQHRIFIKNFARRLLERVVRAAGHAAQQCHRVLVAHFPDRHHLEERLECRAAQPRAFLARGEIHRRSRGVERLRIGVRGHGSYMDILHSKIEYGEVLGGADRSTPRAGL